MTGMTPEVRKAITLSQAEAEKDGAEYITLAHLLRAIARVLEEK